MRATDARVSMQPWNACVPFCPCSQAFAEPDYALPSASFTQSEVQLALDAARDVAEHVAAILAAADRA